MVVTATLRKLSFEEALAQVESGAALVDVRRIGEYLDVHVPGSLALRYESGPGMASRARDCLPISLPLVLCDLGFGDLPHAAASLRGKGFTVIGVVEDAINLWAKAHGAPASTEIAAGDRPPHGKVLDVGDPGASAVDGATRIPIERLWTRAVELEDERRIVIVAGIGVRAGLAVGILERAGDKEIVFWTTGR
jgi:rhodanese-related sulfurtransferase